MERIFSVLAVIALAMLGANFVAGLAIGDFAASGKEMMDAAVDLRKLKSEAIAPSAEVEAAEKKYDQARENFAVPRQRMTFHFFLGVATSLVVVLVNCISVTYFIGTSRWCKEVVDTFRLPASLAEESATLKRKTFPYSLAGMLTMLGIVILGAMSDASVPYNHGKAAGMVQYHYMATMIGTLALAVLFYIQAQRIGQNYQLIQRILLKVEQVRQAQGESQKVASSQVPA